MSWENLGGISTGSMPEDEAWILFALDLAKSYVRFVCGEFLIGCEIEVHWQDNDLGSYPSLSLSSEAYIPQKYIAAAENALRVFDDSVCWSALREHYDQQTLSEDN